MRRDRRVFLRQSLSCAGWLALGLTLAPTAIRRAFAARPLGETVAEEPFARIEQIADGVWSVISTPLKDGGQHLTTVSNGGIIAGKEGVLVVEAFFTDEGGTWLAEQARALTGRDVTHAVVTHHHADHARGLAGVAAGRLDSAGELTTIATASIRSRLEQDEDQGLLPQVGFEGEEASRSIDLGGRVVELTPRSGHTSSDVTIELTEPRVIWCGDLVWNGMFPNYVDAVPSQLTRHCEKILGQKNTVYVPGHGDAAKAAELATYLGLIQDVERAARSAVERGTPAADAAAEYSIPESLGDWFMFQPNYFERAFSAWERELRPEG